MSKPTPYCIGFDAANDFADAFSELDGLADYCIATEKPRVKALAAKCHTHLAAALGEHESFVYGTDPEAA